MKYIAIITGGIAIAFAYMRLFVVDVRGLDLTKETVFKDLAHVYVGTLLGAGVLAIVLLLTLRKIVVGVDSELAGVVSKGIMFGFAMGIMGVALTIVEIFAALTRTP